MRLTPGRLMLLALAAGMLVLGVGAWLGGRSSPHPSAEHSFRLGGGSAEDAWCEPWVGHLLTAMPWAFAFCGLAFVAAALWLAWRESRDWAKSDPGAAGDPARDRGERIP